MSSNINLVGLEQAGYFWITYAIYIILGLVAIILTGWVLMGGTHQKTLLWMLFAVSLLAFIGTIVLLSTKHRLWAIVTLLVQFFLGFGALVITNNAGNVVAADPTGQFATTGRFTAAAIVSVLYLLSGIASIYYLNDKSSV